MKQNPNKETTMNHSTIFKKLFLLLVVLLTTIHANAQSLSYAKSAMEQGKYLDAAKQLRPLADGGNADAQTMAAELFFEGKGVAKNEAQGVKYATLAANQGNEGAIMLLVNHYWSGNPQKAFETLKLYTDRHPYLKKKEVGAMLAECYLRPHGTEQNEELGWQLAENTEEWEKKLQNDQTATRYYDYQMRKAGKNCIEDYADYLFGQRQTQQFQTVCNFIQRQHPNVASYYQGRANEGNAFAQAMTADNYYDRDLRSQARDYLRKALAAGSAYASSIQKKVNFEPATYNSVSCYWTGANNYNKLYIQKIEHRWNKTIIYFNFNAKHAGSWIRFDKGFYAETGGRRYMMTSPTTTKSNPRTNMRDGTDVYFSLEFEAIPVNWDMMTLGLNGRTYVTARKTASSSASVPELYDEISL